MEPTTLAYGGDAPANRASRPGLGSALDKCHLVESSTRLLTRFCNQPGSRGGNRGFDAQGAFGVVISTSFNTVVTGTLNLGPWSGSRGCRNHARHLPAKGVSRCWGCFLSPEFPWLAVPPLVFTLRDLGSLPSGPGKIRQATFGKPSEGEKVKSSRTRSPVTWRLLLPRNKQCFSCLEAGQRVRPGSLHRLPAWEAWVVTHSPLTQTGLGTRLRGGVKGTDTGSHRTVWAGQRMRAQQCGDACGSGFKVVLPWRAGLSGQHVSLQTAGRGLGSGQGRRPGLQIPSRPLSGSCGGSRPVCPSHIHVSLFPWLPSTLPKSQFTNTLR